MVIKQPNELQSFRNMEGSLWHDVVEDPAYSLQQMAIGFGLDVAKMLEKANVKSLLVKLVADRLHNLCTIAGPPQHKNAVV